MFFSNLFKLKKECNHDKLAPNIKSGYCPDCGKFVKNDWYITRCACCGVKLKTNIHNGDIFPQNHYCVNCGSDEFLVEKVETINFIDINYAVLLKRVVEEPYRANSTQCWQERNNAQPKLLGQYL